jgi:P-type E1-E2 ATPase
MQEEGKICVYLADTQKLLGCIYFADVIRPEIKSVFESMRKKGAERIIMLTGDRKTVAAKIAAEIGLEEFEAELLPEDKVNKVKELQKTNPPVVMVGDGINDAPALVSADVGIALGVHGSTAAAFAGDIVIMVNTLERVSEALTIGQRVMTIAKQSIFVGMGLSILFMFVAAFGYIKPVVGALIQEALDIAVILNALRVHFEKKKKTA